MKIAICGVAGHGFEFLKLCHLHPAVESVVFADLAPELRQRASESFPGAQAGWCDGQGEADRVARLKAALESSDWVIRLEAVQALRKIGGRVVAGAHSR